MTSEKHDRVRLLFDEYGPVVKTNTLRENKIFSREIEELISAGLIRRIRTGYYVWASAENDMTDLELASAVIPKGIICLQSAARYYDLSTLNPTVILVAIPSNSMRPVLPDHPPIELVVMSAKHFDLGLTKERCEHGTLRIYDKERTVCDFFKKRNTLGEDLALEVLKSYMGGKRHLQRLFEYAAQLRVKSTIKPYVEALQ